MTDSIQLGEYSMSGGIGGALYNSDGDPNVLKSRYTLGGKIDNLFIDIIEATLTATRL